MILKRVAYRKLLEWKMKEDGRSAILIEGAAAVGKRTLARQFAEQEYISYIYIDFANAARDILKLFENEFDDLDIFFLKLQVFYNVRLTERKSCIILGEVQSYPRVRQMLEYLVADGRYDYIETVSFGHTVQKEEQSIPLKPLGFEEFLDALGEEPLNEEIARCLKKKIAMGEVLHRKAMHLFSIYLIVGGMPQAVSAYIEMKDFDKVYETQRKILKLYRSHICKYAKRYERKVQAVFERIPEQLAKPEKKFMLASIGKEARYREYEDAFLWLKESGIVNLCLHSAEPVGEISPNTERTMLKCYMADTGLLAAGAIEVGMFKKQEFAKEMMFGNIGINEGMFLENAVAQALDFAAYPLLFYSKTDKKDFHNNMKVDFLIQDRKKICPVEVKVGNYRRHTSLDRFKEKYHEYSGDAILIDTKDLSKEKGLLCIPVYMVCYL